MGVIVSLLSTTLLVWEKGGKRGEWEEVGERRED
jgi:hypothetical protein